MTFRFVIFGAFLFLALIFVVAEESLVQTEAFSVETLVDLSVLQSKDMEFLQMAESSWQSLQTNEAAAVTSYAPLDYLNSSYVPVWMNNLSLDDESDIASNYIGCFPAKLGQPLSQQTSSPVYIPTNCWSRCKESKYYAIRDGTCFCGDTFGFDIKNNLVPDAVCRVLHGYSVGSPNGIAMYAVSHDDALKAREGSVRENYIGCFVDNPNKRDLVISNLRFANSIFGANVGQCRSACSRFKYFAIQNYDSCFCSHDYATSRKNNVIVPDPECGVVDGIGPGAKNRNAVYASKASESVEDRKYYARYTQQLVGCFADNNFLDLPIQVLAVKTGDIESCNSACARFKYYSMQDDGKACLCGNSYATKPEYKRVGLQECGVPGSFLLGKPKRNAVYTVSIPEKVLTPLDTFKINIDLMSHYVGCFVGILIFLHLKIYLDDSTRDFPVYLGGMNNPDLTFCHSSCKGYKYFALQNNFECYCGNSFSTKPQYYQRADNECGSGKIRTGGIFRNAIYAMDPEEAAALREQQDTMRVRYVGCFIDSTFRDLKIEVLGIHRSTSIPNCLKKCSPRYKFAAIQANTQCFCSNAIGDYYQVPDSECNAANGLSYGGPMRNAVYSQSPEVAYKTRYALRNNRYTPVDFKFKGCYTSNGPTFPRVMGHITTMFQCFEECTGYEYFSLSNGGYCSCGFTLEEPWKKVADYECNEFFGPGLGSPTRQTIFWIDNFALSSKLTVTKYVPKLDLYQPFKNVDYMYVGCFVDDASRDLPHRILGATTLAACYDACGDYKFFALQGGEYGGCFCGQSFSTRLPHEPANSKECQSMRPWRNAVYAVHWSRVMRQRTQKIRHMWDLM